MSAYAKDIDAGAFQIGGAANANYKSSTIEIDGAPNSDVWQWAYDLDVSYYVIRNIGLGGFVRYAETGVENKQIRSYSYGPMLTYNYSISEAMSLYAKGGLGFLSVNAISANLNGNEYMLGAGVRYFLTSSASLDMGVMYVKQSGDTKESDLSVQAGLSVFLGTK